METCEFCGGMLHADILELDGEITVCKCDEQAHKRFADALKQANKQNAEHWQNGREKYNG